MESLHYRYKPLAEGEIRLVRLSDATPAILGRRLCLPNIFIFHAKLSEVRGAYEALSYVWGTQGAGDEVSVECDGGPFISVGPSLLHALAALLYHSPADDRPGGGERVVWVDALCINQADDAEKSAQVRLMCDIYASAARVVSYLGNEADGSGLAVEFVTEVAERGKAAYARKLETTDWAELVRRKHLAGDDGRTEEISQFIPEMVSTEMSLALLETFRELGEMPDEELFGRQHETRKPAVLKAVGSMMDLPYFQRAWVKQEMAVARDSVSYVGGAQIDLPTLATVASRTLLAARVDWDTYLAADGDEGARSLDFCRGIAGLLATMELGEGKRVGPFPVRDGLTDLLRKFRSARATLAVDKVYSLLGLCASDFPVDYSKSKEATYLDLAAHLVQKGEGEKLLHEAARSECRGAGALKRNGLPSWVPDWEDFPVRTSLGESISRKDGLCFDASRARASRDEERDKKESRLERLLVAREPVPLSVAGGELITEGAIVQRITSLGEAPPSPATAKITTQSNTAHLAQVIEDMAAHRDRLSLRGVYFCPGQGGRPQDLDAALAATLEAGQPGGEFTSWSEDRAVHGFQYRVDRAELRRRVEAVDRKSVGDDAGPLAEFLLETYRTRGFARDVYPATSDEPPPWAANALDNMMKATAGRRFAVARAGFVGLVPGAAEVGDEICVLRGARVPFVLRREDGSSGGGGGTRYSLIGDCYMHGMMHGELFEGDDDGKPKMQRIIIH